MEYSKTFFNKSLEELTYQDIVDFFIDPKEESTTIEFKSFSTQYGNFEKNIEAVIRGISAFLNSEGGVLIWGAPPETVQGTKKVYQGNLSPVNQQIEKDRLINKVSDSIMPLPVGINVKVLTNGADSVCVFEIQKSAHPPHQYKNIYYCRLDGQTKPAPHYLIDALFKRISYPIIEGYLKLERITHDGRWYYLDVNILIFNFSELQNEENVSYRLMCPEGTFVGYHNQNSAQLYLYEGHQFVSENSNILHYAAPFTHVERIAFNPNVIEVNFVLNFGGKYSPMKFSVYKLNLQNINWNQPNNPNYLFTEIKENYLASEKQEELGVTRETLLSKFLGR